MKVTRADVAKLAGVSTATVSYVLNGSRNMSEKTRKRVMDAVEQLNYKPDMIARSMTKNETMQLSLMVNDITNPFFSEIIVGFETAAMEKGYFVNVCTGQKDINSYIDNYVARRIDGVYVAAVPHRFDMDKLYGLTDSGIKVVVSGNAEADIKKVSSIEIDYVGGMNRAMDYLYGLGHRRIAFVSGLSRRHSFDRRVETYLTAVERLKLGYGDELLAEGKVPYDTSPMEGYTITKGVIASGKRFTALICTNDMMTFGAITAIQETGLRVPEDVSVLGFDDITFSRAWSPAVTSVGMDKAAFGRKAFELLHTSIRNGGTGYYLSPLELVERASTIKLKD